MANDELFKTLDDESKPLASRRRLLVEHIQKQLERQRLNPEDSQDIAYEIAGFTATHTAQSLDENDPCSQALDQAVQLELPEAHRSADASWEALAKSIEQTL